MMKKFVTYLLFLALLPAGLSLSGGEGVSAREAMLRERVDRLTVQLAEKEKELKNLRIFLANVGADSRFSPPSEREKRLLLALETLAASASNLALTGAEFCEEVRPGLEKLSIGSAERVRLTFAIEKLERAARQVNTITDFSLHPESSLRECRIIGVKPELELAVLSAGYLHGLFTGMLWQTPDGRLQLRVTEARPLVSGAWVVKGDPRLLSPGVRLVPAHTRIPKTPLK